MIQIKYSLIMNQTLQMDKRCCSLVRNLMQIIIHCMTIAGGIHGGDSLSDVLLINLGYVLLEIMGVIFLANLVNPLPLSRIRADIMSHIKQLVVLLPFGTPSSELQRTLLYYLHIRHMACTLLSTVGLKQSSPK
ncbi:hypothetical protein GIB67_004972 [Kingdonia uniflora]|uniref:Uncharacterized protein n=1 Tax=Kingdonia uniflora TaxID=39325 RepID=A0A7J7NN22_9MAGN|nr:hypothetical protein GIB67_004972 [Kingdonia uniflora]